MSDTIPTESLAAYDQLVEEAGLFERKGKTTPYTSLNGHMTSFLAKDGAAGIRLSSEDIEEFISRFDSELMEQHGRTMKDFVRVSPELLPDTKTLLPYMQKSFDHTSSLKPKPTKKKK